MVQPSNITTLLSTTIHCSKHKNSYHRIRVGINMLKEAVHQLLWNYLNWVFIRWNWSGKYTSTILLITITLTLITITLTGQMKLMIYFLTSKSGIVLPFMFRFHMGKLRENIRRDWGYITEYMYIHTVYPTESGQHSPSS